METSFPRLVFGAYRKRHQLLAGPEWHPGKSPRVDSRSLRRSQRDLRRQSTERSGDHLFLRGNREIAWAAELAGATFLKQQAAQRNQTVAPASQKVLIPTDLKRAFYPGASPSPCACGLLQLFLDFFELEMTRLFLLRPNWVGDGSVQAGVESNGCFGVRRNVVSELVR